MIGVDFDVMLPLFGHVFVTEDGFDRASGLTRAAINAFVGVDIKLCGGLEFGFVLARVNAIHRANVHTRGVFGSDTRFSDDIDCHAFLSSFGSLMYEMEQSKAGDD